MEVDDVKSRLTKFLEAKGISKSEFGRTIGVSSAYITSIRKSIQPEKIKAIKASYNDLNIQWLLTGEGEMLAADEPQLTPEISYSEGVPYYDVDFQLGFEEFEEVDNPNPRYLIRMPGYEKATLWCNASGHSMEPEINHGDILALQRINDFSFLPFGDVYGFITTNGMRTIKRLGRSARQGYYRLIPTNKEYDEQEIPISSIAMVYRVMGAMKAF